MVELKESEFQTIKEYVKKNYGINLNNDKKSLVYSRLRTIVAELGMETFTDYFDYVRKDKTGKAESEFINRISTNHTFFMREKDHFDYLAKAVLPEIEKSHNKDKDMRIWCAACSSGEEAYTLQILLQEYFSNKSWNTQMLATDVSTKVLNLAYRGVYSAEDVKEMPREWVKRYFNQYDSEFYAVKDILKEQILFRRMNLMDEQLGSKFRKPFSVIFCRNVMIYFDEKTRNELVTKFYNMIEPGGYLFIGHSERIDQTGPPFKYIMPAVYKKEI
ncbi:MAG: protein-glutamate O-methyltransferase CheR [Clostridiales bacterium]|jgi:chemotaxis protein methyltransferase CheR|nr:protein-glutamate O-methyltransferase CheR [Clostridiales bacterium]